MTALIRAYDIAPDGLAEALTAERLTDAVPDGKWRWVHLLRTEPDVAAILSGLGLPAAASEALLVEETRPRAWKQTGHTLVILRGINLNEEVGEHPLIALRLCVADRMIITCRKFRFRALEDLVNRCEAGDAPPSPASFVVDLVNGLSSRFATRILDLEERLEAIEDGSNGDREDALTALRRDLLPLARFMQPQREALNRLGPLSQSWAADTDRVELEEAENEFQRLIEHLREVESQALLLKEDMAADTAATQARNTYMITIIAALFVPLSFITGLLGMNVAGIPGAETPYAFALVVLMMAACFVGGLGILKWRGWL